MKKTITESQLRQIVKESVKTILNESIAEDRAAEQELFEKLCELHRLLDEPRFRDALGIEAMHLKNISQELRPMLQKAIAFLKPHLHG